MAWGPTPTLLSRCIYVARPSRYALGLAYLRGPIITFGHDRLMVASLGPTRLDSGCYGQHRYLIAHHGRDTRDGARERDVE